MLRLLCADDQEDVRMLLEAAFEMDGGIEATLVDSGAAALECAARERFDAIVLDGLMPGMDGIDVCHRLKNDPATREVPVLFLTALDADERQRLAAAGASGFIAKPFDPFTVAQQIREQLGRT